MVRSKLCVKKSFGISRSVSSRCHDAVLCSFWFYDTTVLWKVHSSSAHGFCLEQTIPVITSPGHDYNRCGIVLLQSVNTSWTCCICCRGSMEMHLVDHILPYICDVVTFSTVTVIKSQAWNRPLSTSDRYWLSITWRPCLLQLMLLQMVHITLTLLLAFSYNIW